MSPCFDVQKALHFSHTACAAAPLFTLCLKPEPSLLWLVSWPALLWLVNHLEMSHLLRPWHTRQSPENSPTPTVPSTSSPASWPCVALEITDFSRARTNWFNMLNRPGVDRERPNKACHGRGFGTHQIDFGRQGTRCRKTAEYGLVCQGL